MSRLCPSTQLGYPVSPFVSVAAAEPDSSLVYCYLPPSCLCFPAAGAQAETDRETEAATMLFSGGNEPHREVQSLRVERDSSDFVWVGSHRRLQTETAAALRAMQWAGWRVVLLTHNLWGGTSPGQRAEALGKARQLALQGQDCA